MSRWLRASPAQSCFDRAQLLVDDCQRPPGNEHRSAVDDVLARGAEVHVACDVVCQPASQRTDERFGRVPGRASFLGQGDRVVHPVAAHLGNQRTGRGRDQTGLELGRRQGALDLDHRIDPGRVRHRIAQRGRDEDRAEGRQCSKNTVCRSPCMRMSKRRPPSACSATSVARSASGRPLSTRVGRVRLGLIREVEPGELVAQQAAGKDEHVVPRRLPRAGRRLGQDEPERAALGSPAAAPRTRGGRPDLDQPVGDRLPGAVQEPPGDADRVGRVRVDERILGSTVESDRVERPDGLGWGARGHSESNGVAPSPRPRTMSHLKPSAHSGSVVSRSNRDTISSRAFGSRTDV